MIAIFIPNLKCAEFALREKTYLKNNHIFFTNNLSVFSFFNDLKKIKCLNMNSYAARNRLNNLFNSKLLNTGTNLLNNEFLI